MRAASPVLWVLLVLSPRAALGQAEEAAALRAELRRLQRDVDNLQAGVKARDDALDGAAREVRALGGEVAALRAALPSPLATSFLAAPSLPSDTVGVAKVAVFAPRVEVESARQHDNVTLRLRRIESDGVVRVAELELVQYAGGVDLPIDRNGALYIVDWTTTDGYPVTLQLKDGGSGQVAATALVRPQQAQGRFLLVGYRLD